MNFVCKIKIELISHIFLFTLNKLIFLIKRIFIIEIPMFSNFLVCDIVKHLQLKVMFEK